MQLTAEILRKQLPYHCGPIDTAKIAFVGEAPGASEANHPHKHPFVGKSGSWLRTWMKQVGIDPESVYMTNVLKERPLDNNFQKFWKLNPKTIDTHISLLFEELSLLPNLNLIVPVGGRALNVLCNSGTPETNTKKGGLSITNWRGSIISANRGKITGKKCIPIIHPAAIMRAWLDRVPTLEDLKRISEDQHFPELRLPEREYLLRPTFDEAIEFLTYIYESKRPISIDTETKRGGYIATNQFCIDSKTAMCIPFQYQSGLSYFSLDQEQAIWRAISQILHNRKIVGQNFMMFDTFIYGMNGMNWKRIINNVVMDIMEGHQCLQPQLPKSLAFLTSIYTREPYYNSKGASGKKDVTRKEWAPSVGENKFWTYGCKDVVVVQEIYPQVKQQLLDAGLLDFYEKRYHKMAHRRLSLSFNGIKFDDSKRKAVGQNLQRQVIKYHCKLMRITGENLNVKSAKQMKKLLYETMKLPVQKTRQGKVTTGEDALLALAASHPSETFDCILKVRHYRTRYSNYVKVKVDSDGRIRSSFGFAETGRFTSSKCAFGTGYNLQNWPRDMRVMLCADTPDDVFVEMDFKQAESMAVAFKSRDVDLIQGYLDGIDMHKRTATHLFEKDMDDIIYGERYTGKRVNHAANYEIGHYRFAQVWNKDAADNNVNLIDGKTAKTLLDRHHKAIPSIRGIYQKEIREEVSKTKMMVNVWGRRMIFHDRIAPDLFRQAYAWWAQSLVGDLTNIVFDGVADKVTVVNQGHDSLLVHCRKSHFMEDSKILLDKALIPIQVEGRELIIPVEFKVGHNWKEMQEFEVTI